MEETFADACAAHAIPGVVLLATSRDGTFNYTNTFGRLSVADPQSHPVAATSPMWIASCTKLLTTIAALQCVERGLVALDDADALGAILPELRDAEILTHFDADSGKPVYVKAQNRITLRHLLTHSAGLGYDLFHPVIQKWRRSRGQESIAPGTTVHERYLGPLLYEPGTGWEYSPAIDFAGQLVERVTAAAAGEGQGTGGNLQDYMQREIWAPLGIEEMTFFVHDMGEEWKERMPAMSVRDAESGKAVLKPKVVPPEPRPEEAMGGGGIYATPVDYLKVLHAVLKNDGLLLKQETVNDMFRSHLSQGSQQALMKLLQIPEVNLMMGGLPEGTELNWGLGGLLLMDDLPGWRRRGTLTWGGMPNLTWVSVLSCPHLSLFNAPPVLEVG